MFGITQNFIDRTGHCNNIVAHCGDTLRQCDVTSRQCEGTLGNSEDTEEHYVGEIWPCVDITQYSYGAMGYCYDTTSDGNKIVYFSDKTELCDRLIQDSCFICDLYEA